MEHRTLDIELHTLNMSALLRLAVADARRVQQMKGYILNMGTWHSPFMNQGKQISCNVCLGGAVIVKHDRNENPTRSAAPFNYDKQTEGALNALDDLRVGDLWNAFESLTGVRPDGRIGKQLDEGKKKAGLAFERIREQHGLYFEKVGGIDTQLEDLDVLANALEDCGL